ncbi:MAG: hypothetical protein V1738_02060 [Patescibacteria group bacterium]
MANLFDWKAGKYNALMGKIAERLTPEQGEMLLENPERIVRMVASITESVTIDCDAPIPKHLKEGFTRHEEDQISSRVCGTVLVDPANPFHTVLVHGQDCGAVEGEKVLGELRRRNAPVYGIAALEQMRQEGLIPDSLKGQAIFAWGDVLRGGDGSLFVRYLYGDGGEWRWIYYWLGSGWDPNDPAAVRAS